MGQWALLVVSYPDPHIPHTIWGHLWGVFVCLGTRLHFWQHSASIFVILQHLLETFAELNYSQIALWTTKVSLHKYLRAYCRCLCICSPLTCYYTNTLMCTCALFLHSLSVLTTHLFVHCWDMTSPATFLVPSTSLVASYYVYHLDFFLQTVWSLRALLPDLGKLSSVGLLGESDTGACQMQDTTLTENVPCCYISMDNALFWQVEQGSCHISSKTAH